jgi:hypothetical protein
LTAKNRINNIAIPHTGLRTGREIPGKFRASSVEFGVIVHRGGGRVRKG